MGGSGAIPIGIDDEVPFENSGIYIILSAVPSEAHLFHWGLYISVNGGQIYHARNDGPDRTWKVEAKNRDTLIASKSMRLAMKIGTVKSSAQADEADELLRAVPVAKHGEYMEKYRERFTCRIWVREALDALNGAKIVQFECSTEDIQDEATSVASRLVMSGVKGLAESDFTI